MSNVKFEALPPGVISTRLFVFAPPGSSRNSKISFHLPLNFESLYEDDSGGWKEISVFSEKPWRGKSQWARSRWLDSSQWRPCDVRLEGARRRFLIDAGKKKNVKCQVWKLLVKITLTFNISRFLLLLRNQKSPSTFHSSLSRSMKLTVEDGRRFSNFSEDPGRKKCQMSSLKVAPQNHIGRLPWHLTFLDFCFCWEIKKSPSTFH